MYCFAKSSYSCLLSISSTRLTSCRKKLISCICIQGRGGGGCLADIFLQLWSLHIIPTKYSHVRPKIKFICLALPPDPLKNLPPKLFYFAFETKKNLIKKIGIAPEFRSCPQRLFRAFFISNLDRKIAWCTLYWEQTFKRHRIENGLLKRK
jgi:hypothetical protein